MSRSQIDAKPADGLNKSTGYDYCWICDNPNNNSDSDIGLCNECLAELRNGA